MMQYSRFFKVFSLVLASQFLNVQVQTAFATDAITGQSPEAQAMLEQAKEKLGTHLSGMSENGIYHLAYRFFKRDIKGRNRIFNKSGDEVQKIIEDLDQGKVSAVTAEDMDAVGDLNEDRETLQVLATTPAANAPVLSHKEIKREELLEKADLLLLSLGASTRDNGKLLVASFETFKNKLNEMKPQAEARAPASVLGWILKIILALIVLAIGLTGMAMIFLIIGFGGTSVLLYIGLAGIIIGEIFAIRGIISIDVQVKKMSSLQLA